MEDRREAYKQLYTDYEDNEKNIAKSKIKKTNKQFVATHSAGRSAQGTNLILLSVILRFYC